MKGYLKVEAAKDEKGHEGLQLSCELEHVGAMDRFHILQVVCDAIHMNSGDLKMFCTMKEIGLFGALTERHTKCDEAIPEQGGRRGRRRGRWTSHYHRRYVRFGYGRYAEEHSKFWEGRCA